MEAKKYGQCKLALHVIDSLGLLLNAFQISQDFDSLQNGWHHRGKHLVYVRTLFECI